MRWVKSLLWGVRECIVLGSRGGGESARAKWDAWESVVEDGELHGCRWVNGMRGKCKPDKKAKTRQRRRVKTK